jgi:hypothetical protein
MMTLEDIAAKNDAIVINEVPGISWRIVGARRKEKTQPPLLHRLLGICKEDDGEEEDGAKGYVCWTCGAAYDTSRAMEFLRHIKVCCKDDSSYKTMESTNRK